MASKRTALSILACALCIAAGPIESAPATQAVVAASAPVDLRAENSGALLGTDVARPRLSWLAGPETSEVQTHYQIQVAASEAALTRGDLVWDSGRVASNRRAQIVYGGPTLASRTRYVWRVRTYHGVGRASAWSRPGWWEMGLLDPAEWLARWISMDQPVQHVWSDATSEWRFTPLGGPVDFLFRASPVGKTFGEAYAWRFDIVADRPRLTAISRRYDGSAQAVVRERVIKTIDLALTRDEWVGRPHLLSIAATGSTIVTSLDGAVIDRMTDRDHARGTAGMFQRGLSSADWRSAPEAFVLHSLKITPASGPVAFADFAGNANPLSGGTIEADGLRPGNAGGIDIVFPQGAPAPLLRKTFDLKGGEVTRARLYVAAGGFPRIELNGRQVNEAIADGFTAYDRRVLYRTFDVTRALRRGANAIGAELGRGWYDLTEPNEWYWHNPPWRNRPALRLQLEVTFADGSRQVVASDGSWRAHAGPTLHDSIYAGERHDARAAQPGWSAPGFDDRNWRAAALVGGPVGRLDAAEQQPIAVTAKLRPVSLTQAKRGVWIFDFGRIFAGRVRLKARGAAGQTISLVQHEKLNADGTVNALSTHVDSQLQTEHYTLAGRGLEEWAPQFGYRGFRYVEVRGFPGRPTLDSVTGEVMHSDVASVGSFDSANPLLNRIQQAARITLLNNMHGFQTDTPTFEKNGWTGDAQASALAAVLNFDVARVWTKWLADFRDAQAPSGEIPEIVPSTPLYGYENTPGWRMVEGPTPAWDAAAFVLPDELYRTTGDTRLLAEMYDTQKRLVDYTTKWFTPGDFRYRSTNNTDLGEYAYPREPAGSAHKATLEDVGAVSTAYLFYMTDRLARNAELLGHAADARRYAAQASRIRDAYNRRYWDAALGLYRVRSASGIAPAFVQYHNILPVAFGIVPEGAAKAVIDKVAADIVAHGYHLRSMGVYSGRHALTLLSDYGHGETVYRVVTRTNDPSWGFWLSRGIQTMLEMWDLNSRSYDHHYWASVSSWFYEGLAGIRPATPAYETVVIQPVVPRDLARASAQLDTVQGRISSAWRQSRGAIMLDVTIPAGVRAEIRCPGSTLAAPVGGQRLRGPDQQDRFVVIGGSHRMVCAQPPLGGGSRR